MEIETHKFYESKPGQKHHNLSTIADVLVSAKENYILHKSITLVIFHEDHQSIETILRFDFEGNFIKSGCGLSAWIRRFIEDKYVSGRVFRVEVNPEEVD